MVNGDRLVDIIEPVRMPLVQPNTRLAELLQDTFGMGYHDQTGLTYPFFERLGCFFLESAVPHCDE